MKNLVDRIKKILLHPKDEWRVIKDEQATYRQIIAGYVAVLAAIPPLSAILVRLIVDRGIAGIDKQNPLTYVVAVNILWYAVIIVNMMITGAVITVMVTGLKSARSGLRGLELAAYSFTPLFIVSLPVIIPKLNWLIYCAALYSIYLLYLGTRSMMEVKPGKAAWYAVVSFLAAGAVVGLMNLFEYMLESFIANMVFF